MGRVLRSVDDLTDTDVAQVLDRARSHRAGTASPVVAPPLVGLCFLEASLRTRVGFAAAAARLGGSAVGVSVQRASDISMPESVHDTLRTLLGYMDVVVARPGVELAPPHVPADTATPLISGGDRGPRAEHPSQALIDLLAICDERGSLAAASLAICGDPRMRSVASLLRLAVRFPLRLVTRPSLTEGFRLPAGLETVEPAGSLQDVQDVDVLYVAGIPHGARAGGRPHGAARDTGGARAPAWRRGRNLTAAGYRRDRRRRLSRPAGPRVRA
jgi:aspartate carbamoyltransferase catalytic subunit